MIVPINSIVFLHKTVKVQTKIATLILSIFPSPVWIQHYYQFMKFLVLIIIHQLWCQLLFNFLNFILIIQNLRTSKIPRVWWRFALGVRHFDLACGFCKMRNGLGRISRGCGFEPHMWHFSANVWMRNLIFAPYAHFVCCVMVWAA